ncbi:MAG: SDR family oxidoreductase [Bacteroidota bacterium]
MNNEFNNEWILILGGSSGLGLASAKKMAAHGANVCIVHRDRKVDLELFTSEVEEIRSHGGKVLTFNQDALKPETITEVISEIPKNSIKVLLHSIAKGSLKPLIGTIKDQLTKEDLAITVNAMALSWLDWTQALVKENKFTANARNIAFTSEGNSKALMHYGAVSVAKASLEALMRQMAVEMASMGLTTNCIQAGVTQTKSFGMIPGSERLAAIAQKRNPFKRLTTPEDVANAVYLLAKNEAQWINGTVLKVDGGESLR